MDAQILMIFLSIMIFGTYSILQDIYERKISNVLNLMFFVVSFVFFITSIYKFFLVDFVVIFISILIIFYLYKKNLWGAADGKVFISLILMLSIIDGVNTIVYYITNLVIFYSIGSVVLSLIMTSRKDKKKVLFDIDYKTHIFIVSCIFIVSSFILKRIPKSLDPVISFSVMLLTILVLILFIKKLRVFFNKFNEHIKNHIILVQIVLLILISHTKFLIYFFPILLLKISIDYLSSLTRKIRHNRKEEIYSSPFSIYLFLVALFTILLNNALVVIIVEFFMK